MAQANSLGTAFLFVNSYRKCSSQLDILLRIDEAAKDFWKTFNTLGFRTVIYHDKSKEDFDEILAAEKAKLAKDTAKYVVFYFIGHGGDADVLFMEDGREVKTKDVVEGFASLPGTTRKVFFIDACRGRGLKVPFCPTLPNSFLARSTLPYRKAHARGTYGKIQL